MTAEMFMDLLTEVCIFTVTLKVCVPNLPTLAMTTWKLFVSSVLQFQKPLNAILLRITEYNLTKKCFCLPWSMLIMMLYFIFSSCALSDVFTEINFLPWQWIKTLAFWFVNSHGT